MGKCCLYIKRLSDVDQDVLGTLVAQSMDAFRPLSRLVRDQAHAGHSGFGFLKLGHVHLDQVEAAVAKALGGAGIAGRKDQAAADAQAIRSGGLIGIDGHGIDVAELRRIDASAA